MCACARRCNPRRAPKGATTSRARHLLLRGARELTRGACACAARWPRTDLARFDRALRSNDEGPFLVGSELSFVDIQLFQALTQLANAGVVDLKAKWPELEAYRQRIAQLPPVAEYLASGRQLPFPGRGGKAKFIADVAKVIPWVFGKGGQPELLCDVWHFKK